MGLTEFALIDWLRRQAETDRPDILAGIGDDMAVLHPGDDQVLITTDTLLEGVHFAETGVSPEQIGYKAFACSLSDCAAMAARPWCAVAAVSLPRHRPAEYAQKLFLGMQHAARRYDCPLVGGDTTTWNHPLAVTITMLARTDGIAPIRRTGARPGDALFVTGDLGGSQAGRHLCFEPRLAEARELAHRVNLHAMLDISDGLAGDLQHLCRAGRVGAVLDVDAIPLSPAARRTTDPLKAALTDGEDYELLFCVDEHDARHLETTWPGSNLARLTRIGTIVPESDAPPPYHIALRHPTGTIEPLTLKGWEHTLQPDE